jgi:hypothetical protein
MMQQCLREVLQPPQESWPVYVSADESCLLLTLLLLLLCHCWWLSCRPHFTNMEAARTDAGAEQVRRGCSAGALVMPGVGQQCYARGWPAVLCPGLASSAMPGVGQQWYAVEDTKKHAAKRCDCYACISHGQKWLCLCALVAGASQALALQFCCFFAVRAGGWLCANRLAVRDEVVHLPQPRQGPLQRAPGALQRAQQLRRAEGVRGMAATQTGAQALDVQLAWL